VLGSGSEGSDTGGSNSEGSGRGDVNFPLGHGGALGTVKEGTDIATALASSVTVMMQCRRQATGVAMIIDGDWRRQESVIS
jgi:hypothetical protein